MEVKGAIRKLEILPDYFEIGEPVSFNNLMAIKKESVDIISLLKSLEAENKALKKERDAYKGMWEELKKGYSRDGVYFYHDCSDNNDEYVNDVIRELEKKYQQKHYPEVGNEDNQKSI